MELVGSAEGREVDFLRSKVYVPRCRNNVWNPRLPDCVHGRAMHLHNSAATRLTSVL